LVGPIPDRQEHRRGRLADRCEVQSPTRSASPACLADGRAWQPTKNFGREGDALTGAHR